MGCKSTCGWSKMVGGVFFFFFFYGVLREQARRGERGFADSAVLAELSSNEGRVEESLTVTHRTFYLDVCVRIETQLPAPMCLTHSVFTPPRSYCSTLFPFSSTRTLPIGVFYLHLPPPPPHRDL